MLHDFVGTHKTFDRPASVSSLTGCSRLVFCGDVCRGRDGAKVDEVTLRLVDTQPVTVEANT